MRHRYCGHRHRWWIVDQQKQHVSSTLLDHESSAGGAAASHNEATRPKVRGPLFRRSFGGPPKSRRSHRLWVRLLRPHWHRAPHRHLGFPNRAAFIMRCACQAAGRRPASFYIGPISGRSRVCVESVAGVEASTRSGWPGTWYPAFRCPAAFDAGRGGGACGGGAGGG